MRTVWWTDRAQDDLAAIHAFITVDSEHYASVNVRRIIGAVGQLREFPFSGRSVPEFADDSVREFVRGPYRIVYRLVGDQDVHVLTVHHGARPLPDAL